MTRILVTGAESPAGGELVRLLLEAGYEVRALFAPDASLASWTSSGAELVQGTLDDAALAEEVVADADAVVHLYVRMVAPEGVSDSENLRHNLLCTLNAARFAAQAGTRLERFVCGSSSSVYANDTHVIRALYQPVDENHPLRPLDAYSLARLGGERIVQAYWQGQGLPISIIRESGVLSGKDVLSRWTAGFVAIVLEIGQEHPESALWSPDGREAVAQLRELTAAAPDQPCAVTDRQGRPWVYQPVDYRDLAAGFLCALSHPRAVGRAYNIACGQPLSFPRAAALLAEALGQEVLAWQAPTRWVYDLDCTRARVEIGYKPKWTIERMIEEAARG